MTREEAIGRLVDLRVQFQVGIFTREAIAKAIEALSADAVQGCDGCKYNTRTPQEQCLRCKRYWKDSYERKGGD